VRRESFCAHERGGQRRGPAASLLLLLRRLGAKLEPSLTTPLLRDVPSVCTGRPGGTGAGKASPYRIVMDPSEMQFVVFLKLSS